MTERNYSEVEAVAHQLDAFSEDKNQDIELAKIARFLACKASDLELAIMVLANGLQAAYGRPRHFAAALICLGFWIGRAYERAEKRKELVAKEGSQQ